MKQLIKIKPSGKATLSMCGLGEKTSELISFMKKANVDILSMVDIRRKDKKTNMQEVFKKHVLIWSRCERTNKIR